MKCWVFLLSCAVMGPAEAAANSVDELIRGIAENEKVVLNLRVEAEWSALQRRDDEEKWEGAGDGKVTAWLLGMPGSKLELRRRTERPGWEGLCPLLRQRWYVRSTDVLSNSSTGQEGFRGLLGRNSEGRLSRNG